MEIPVFSPVSSFGGGITRFNLCARVEGGGRISTRSFGSATCIDVGFTMQMLVSVGSTKSGSCTARFSTWRIESLVFFLGRCVVFTDGNPRFNDHCCCNAAALIPSVTLPLLGGLGAAMTPTIQYGNTREVYYLPVL